MKTFLKGLLHLFVSTAATAATAHIYSGAPITSGNVLVPSLVAGGLAVAHAAFPSIVGLPPAAPPPTGNFPTSR